MHGVWIFALILAELTLCRLRLATGTMRRSHGYPRSPLDFGVDRVQQHHMTPLTIERLR